MREIERDGEAVEGERESQRDRERQGDVQCSLIDNSYSNLTGNSTCTLLLRMSHDHVYTRVSLSDP